ncbi:UNVERIFIED_ORG: hypothetical protein M2328_006068 [Rhodococcus erythropolis]
MTAKVTLGATIPTTQYGNLQPSFEMEGATVDAALDAAVLTMQRFWNLVSDKPLTLREVREVVASTAVELTCWASGSRVLFDPVAHRYSPGEWLSGSAFAGRYKSAFAAEYVAGQMSAKTGGAATTENVLAMWAKNGEASSSFGTAVHAALELYGKYLHTSRAVKDGSDESALTKNPVLQPIVKSFFDGRDGDLAEYEVFVADPVLRHCGQIDRLLITGPRSVRVQDFKSNATLDDRETIKAPFKGVVASTKLGAYWLQLSFYAGILIRHGWTVEGLDIFHLQGDGSWVTHSHDVVDISEVI